MRELGGAEALPRDQHQQLAIVVTKPLEGTRRQERVGTGLRSVVHGTSKLRAYPYRELGATMLSTPVVGDDAPAGRIEPKQSFVATRNDVETTP